MHYWIEVESEFRGSTAKVGMSRWTPEVSNLEVSEVSGGRRRDNGAIYVWLNRGLVLKTDRKEVAVGYLRKLVMEAPPQLEALKAHLGALERAVTG